MPETLTATYRIVTPMFIGDAHQEATEITAASVKGALRFWWRALNWGRFRNQTGASDETALKALHTAEAELFGASADERFPGRGQGSFLLKVTHGDLTKLFKDTLHPDLKPTRRKRGERWPDQNHMAAARYLGYGLIVAATTRNRETREVEKEAGQLERSCFDTGQTFTIQLLFRGKVDTSIVDAVKALGLLGGLGSRVRHGFGSTTLVNLKVGSEEYPDIHTKDDYLAEIKSLFEIPDCLAKAEPCFSAFSKMSRIDHLLSASTYQDVLDHFGQSMLLYRSWGRSENGNILPDGSESEQNFPGDHHWSKGMGKPGFHPKRVVFGLPHNYGKYDNLKVDPVKYERRASPLIFHVHQVGNEFFGISIFLRSHFLPVGEKINAGGSNVAAKIEWDLITEFLTGTNKQGKLRFSRTPILEATA